MPADYDHAQEARGHECAAGNLPVRSIKPKLGRKQGVQLKCSCRHNNTNTEAGPPQGPVHLLPGGGGAHRHQHSHSTAGPRVAVASLI